MSHAFSKILILTIFIILAGGGIFAWQYFGAPEEKIADIRIYTNSQVGYQFEYPKTGLSLELDETIKTPTQNLVQFATEETAYGVRIYTGITHKTLEEWIADPGTAKASSALSDYNKITVGSEFAYQYKEGLVVYVLNSGNLYQITARQGIAPSQNFTDPIYNHLLSTFRFIERGEPYIEILNPNGGEKWFKGETYEIEWQSEGVKRVAIELRQTGEVASIIIAYLENNPGIYGWVIPENIFSDIEAVGLDPDRLRIFIFDRDRTERSDVSDSSFSIKEAVTTSSKEDYEEGMGLEELMSNKYKYIDKNITLKGFYFSGFHYQNHKVTILAPNLEKRPFRITLKESSPTYEKIFPDGIGIWVSDPSNLLENKKLYQQIDPKTNETEYYGKIRAEGKFKRCAAECDDLGLHNYQIVLSRTEILSWSSNEAQKAFLEISYPNGGEKLEKGKTYEVTWRSSGLENEGGHIYLRGENLEGIATGGNLLLNADSFPIEDGKYSLTIPAIIPPGDKYKLVITSTNCRTPKEFCQQVFKFAKPSISDESDNYLSVVE